MAEDQLEEGTKRKASKRMEANRGLVRPRNKDIHLINLYLYFFSLCFYFFMFFCLFCLCFYFLMVGRYQDPSQPPESTIQEEDGQDGRL